MFPVAFAIFDKETIDNWEWFLLQLKKCVGDDEIKVIHSDANKGLETAIPNVFPTGVEHRECFRHLLGNFKKRFKGAILQHMWPAAWAYTTDKHNEYMNLVAKDRPDAIEYLEKNHKHLWSRSKFSTVSKVEYVNNNLAESFNSWIRNIKGYTLVELVDTLRTMIMVKLASRYKIAQSLEGYILPHVIKELNQKSKGLHYNVDFSSNYAAQVSGMSKDKKAWRVGVDLSHHTCTCGQWQLSGKPCTHALAAIFSNPELNLESFVSVYYSVDLFQATYSGFISPMTDKSNWPRVDLGFRMLPPLLGRSAGRPRKKRIRSHGEAAVKSKVCTRCKQYGHIARGCRNKMAPANTLPYWPTNTSER